MQLTQNIAKFFGYIKISSLIIIIGLGIYGVAAGKGDLSIFSTENTINLKEDRSFPGFSHIGEFFYFLPELGLMYQID